MCCNYLAFVLLLHENVVTFMDYFTYHKLKWSCAKKIGGDLSATFYSRNVYFDRWIVHLLISDKIKTCVAVVIIWLENLAKINTDESNN